MALAWPTGAEAKRSDPGKHDRPIPVRLALGSALLLAATAAAAQGPPTVFGWIRDHAHRFALGDSTGTGLGSLAERLDGARLIGVGESIHFQREFLELRSALLRELVSRKKVTAVALESGLPEAIALDRYVTGQTDRIDWPRVLNYESATFTEIRAAFEWLRAWNREPGHRAVHVYGVDLPAGGGGMLAALAPLLEYLDRVDPTRAARARRGLLPLATRLDSPYFRQSVSRYDSLPPSEKHQLDREVAALSAAVRAGAASYPKRSSRDEYDWAVRFATVCEQEAVFLRLSPYHPTNPRDVAMAANTEWVMRREGPEGHVVLWAHNAHVSKRPIEGPASPARTPVPSMGSLLANTLGPGYRVVGTTYGRAVTDSLPDPSSLDAAMAAADSVPYWVGVGLDGRDLTPDVRQWLDAPHPIQFQGVGYLALVPRLAFDVVVYFPRIQPATRHP
jgi:erythromycin esterase